MRKAPSLLFSIFVVSFLLLLSASGTSRGESRMEPKGGDEVYACACGSECDCGTLSRVANICSCGRDMVKSSVV
jgi:hypothetical protein